MPDSLKPMNVFTDTLERVRAAARAVLPEGVDLSRVQVEPPREVGYGEIATNAAMVLVKYVRQNPRQLADKIAARLREDTAVASAEIAGPGFINLRLKPEVWMQELRRAVMAGDDYDGKPFKNDVWYSTDGEHWVELPNTPWIERHAASVFVLNNTLFMMGGTPVGQATLNDIWKLVVVE